MKDGRKDKRKDRTLKEGRDIERRKARKERQKGGKKDRML